ncbi:uncharacterized protein MELLADRAFT_64734 [Melampsora larici-populina 98AG31]|uniref:Uncharacterized protein n=1 Tax=Melampsora larici-populina (strain 98AG31 / pathotype 3-4-7) TaxID=747676 RepID=F4RSK5_MELLP|nr:uncharacterized protein MELLADRAFT_64734 [Melampsora larici-populina 98AG31]EGG04678.1 hypothetical protein MELLADRAFT_64734 [Melampsora larici-populina 98AG31]
MVGFRHLEKPDAYTEFGLIMTGLCPTGGVQAQNSPLSLYPLIIIPPSYLFPNVSSSLNPDITPLNQPLLIQPDFLLQLDSNLLVLQRNFNLNQSSHSMSMSSRKLTGGEADQKPVEHYNSQDIVILTPERPPTHTRGVCLLQTPAIGQSPTPRIKDKPMDFGASAMGIKNDQLTFLKDMLSTPTIIITPDGLSYHGGVHIPRNHWWVYRLIRPVLSIFAPLVPPTLYSLRTSPRVMIDGRPNLLFDQMQPGQMPKFEDMSMRELAEWRLGVMIQTPEAGVLFNRAFNLKRAEEGFSHLTYPVPFTGDMPDDVDEMIISLEYDTHFITRCISLAEDAAAHNRLSLVPSLSMLHGVDLRDTRCSSNSSDASDKASNRDGLQNPSCVNKKHGTVNQNRKLLKILKSAKEINLLTPVFQSANALDENTTTGEILYPSSSIRDENVPSD